MTDSILILGAGIYQVPLIKKVKEMGYRAVVVSRKGNYPGFNFSDVNYYVDTTNKDGVLEIAKREAIRAIVTTGTDVPIRVQGHINDKLGLYGISEVTGEITNNKLLMKQIFEKYNVKTPQYVKVSNENEALDAYNKLNKPLIFKAVDSSGSRGIIKVTTFDEVRHAINEVLKVTQKGYFIIEEFIEGTEFGAQALIQDSRMIVCLPHDDTVYWAHTGVPIGHSAPLGLSDEVQKRVNSEVEKACKALGINNSAVNVDFIIKGDEIYILEIGSRAGATCLPELVSISYETDYYRHIIDVALGQKVNIQTTKIRPNASILLYSEKEGYIKRIINENNVDKHILDISFDYKTKDKVNKFIVGPDRIGQIIVSGETVEDAKKRLENVRNKIKVIVESEIQ